MNDLVFLQDGQAMTDSLIMAEYFEKRHSHVLDTIREILSDLPEASSQPTFRPRDYVDCRGKTQPKFDLNRDGAILLLNTFKGRKARLKQWQVIQAMNALEAHVKRLEAEQLEAPRNPPQISLAGISPYQTVSYYIKRRLKIENPPRGLGHAVSRALTSYCLKHGIAVMLADHETGQKQAFHVQAFQDWLMAGGGELIHSYKPKAKRAGDQHVITFPHGRKAA